MQTDEAQERPYKKNCISNFDYDDYDYYLGIVTWFTLLALYKRNIHKINENTNIASGWKYGLYIFHQMNEKKSTRTTHGKESVLFCCCCWFCLFFLFYFCGCFLLGWRAGYIQANISNRFIGNTTQNKWLFCHLSSPFF